jgi:hypothetical protein
VNTKLQWSHGRLNSATNFTKPKKNTNIFGFSILKQEQKEMANKAEYFWIFFKYQTENSK